MLIRRVFAIGCVSLVLAACVGPQQKPVTVSDSGTTYKGVRMGVAMTELPKVQMQFPGAGCLLCLAAASLGNSTLSTYTETLPRDDLLAIKSALAKKLQSTGATVTLIDENLILSGLPDFKAKGEGVAPKDFSRLKQQYNIDKLLVIDISAVGMNRSYASYIPTSDPKGWVVGKGYLVDLSTNAYEWYQPVEELKSSDGVWDEPPNYPGLTNAYFQAIELAKDEFLKPFAGQ